MEYNIRKKRLEKNFEDIFKLLDANLEEVQNIDKTLEEVIKEPTKQIKCSIEANTNEDGKGSVKVVGMEEDLIRLAYQIIDGMSKGMEIPFNELMLEILLIKLKGGI